MNWLNPEQVREWLEANSPHVSGYHEETIDPEAVKYAWKQFGLAVAASDDMKDDPIRSWDNAVDVARIIRDAGKNGL